MDRAPKPEPENKRELDLGLEVLRNKLSHVTIYERNVEVELAELRHNEPLVDEIIRHLSERFFPGSRDMYSKEKAVRMLLAAFSVDREITSAFKHFDVETFFTELDKLTAGTSPEAPETDA